MENRDCNSPAPFFYRMMMQGSHVISYPVYITTLVILFREQSKAFRTYKYYIIVHTVINMACETFVSFLMLPMTYLPHTVLRTTGLLARWGFSGVFQWYCLATIVMFTGGSICEMFYYRFKIGIFNYKEHNMTKFVVFCIWAFRILALAHTIFAICTVSSSQKIIAVRVAQLIKDFPSLPLEVTCFSVLYASNGDWINLVTMSIYTIMIVLAVSGATSSLVYMVVHLRKGSRLSKATIKMQYMLIGSLFIQGGVHVAMIAAPIVFLIYARFNQFTFDEVALLMLMALAYHGFFSTCAMIIFTKPVRDGIFRCKRQTVRSRVVSVQQTISIAIKNE